MTRGCVEVLKIYENMGSPVYIRSKNEYLKLIAPWTPDEKGFVSLLEWHGLGQALS